MMNYGNALMMVNLLQQSALPRAKQLAEGAVAISGYPPHLATFIYPFFGHFPLK